MTTHGIRLLDPRNQRDVAAIARLHLELLPDGPMAQLGELFLRRFCYQVLLRDGLMRAALYEVDGTPVGFVAYTERSISFHRSALRRHAGAACFNMVLSLLRHPRALLRLPRAVGVVLSRRAEVQLGEDPLAEIVSIGVLPEYRTPRFMRQTGIRVSEALVQHAADFFQEAGLEEMRMIVEVDNKATLLFYHSLGARLEPYRQAGRPMVQVHLSTHLKPRTAREAAAVCV